MGVFFEFDIPKEWRLDAICYLDTIKWSEEAAPAARRLAANMRASRTVTIHAFDGIYSHEGYPVKVDIRDLPALEVILMEIHSQEIPPGAGDDQDMQLEWESWSWDALHLLSFFQNNSSIVDFIGDIDRCAVERLLEAAE